MKKKKKRVQTTKYKFGARSLKNIAELHPDLQTICFAAIDIVDFTVITGHRTKDKQNRAYETGASKLKWPQSKHNKKPSKAFDFIPSPFQGWKRQTSFYHLAGVFIALGYMYGVDLRSGMNWDRDNDLKDQSFIDSGHLELV